MRISDWSSTCALPISQLGDNGVLGAIINAVRSDTDSNILSTPSVMTLDNQKASILVGQQVPVTTGEALSQNFDNQFRTVQRQDVGIKLEVKPRTEERLVGKECVRTG